MRLKSWQNYFKDKKVIQMGLGLLGRGVGDAAFLARQGAELTVTDLKTRKDLLLSLKKLEKFKAIKYILGKHRLEDFSAESGQARPDFILKAAGVPLDSPYIAAARRNNIPIEMDASLFVKLAPSGVKMVGVTGTRGKSTTTALIYEILSQALKKKALGAKKVYKGGNLVSQATLSLLKKVRSGDIVVLELDSWQLQGFYEAEISPQVAVFTTFFDDHLVYYKGDRKRYFEDKAAIFKYQRKGDVLVVGEQAAPRVRAARPPVAPVVARAADIPENWKIKLIGRHNRGNIACAVAAAHALNIPDAVIKRAVEDFRGLPGRMEYLRAVKEVRVYNDSSATTPDATTAALRALNPKSEIRNPKQIPNSKSQKEEKIILIMGGTDKGLVMSELIAEVPKHCRAVVLLEGTGTKKLKRKIADKWQGIKTEEKETFRGCVTAAVKLARKGDTVLFSPAFSSFGRWFKNEYDRGEQFVELIRKL